MKTHFSSFDKSLFSSSWHFFVFAIACLLLGLTITAPLQASDLQMQDLMNGIQELKIGVSMVRKCLPAIAHRMYAFQPATKSTFDPQFEDKLQHYYGTTSCMILGQLFPECLTYQGAHHYFGPDYFKPVGEHIYKKSMQAQGTDLGIDTTHPRNGLLLVKALEEMFQEGHLVLIPVSQNCEEDTQDFYDLSDDGQESVSEMVTLKIQVADEFLQDKVMWQDQVNKSLKRPMMRPILDKRKNTGNKGKGKGRLQEKPIKYEDLQDQKIKIRKPYMVSLYMQAQYAHEAHSELPNPEDNALLRQFFDKCREGMRFLLERLCRIESVPDHQEKWMTVPREDAFAGDT